MPEEVKPLNVYEGSKKVTCTEAAIMLHDGRAIRVWFRPDGILNHQDPGSDPAFVWASE